MLPEFIQTVEEEGARLYRSLPWREVDDPYLVLASEVMLQQTQVSRLLKKWDAWVELFPSAEALAAAPLPVVLEAWQGMGYNRRALNLKRAAEALVEEHGGEVPREEAALLALPGVGPATAAGVRVFAFQEPAVYLETNVRTVFLHHFFPDEEGVRDRQLVPLIEEACPQPGSGRSVRAWYYALLDYGAHLKRVLPNPSRRSLHHSRQSAFEGSHRQKRAALLRFVLEGLATTEDLKAALNAREQAAGRPPVETEQVELILTQLATEGFLEQTPTTWLPAEH